MPLKRGFTLLELMIVIAIAGMSIILTPPILRWLDQKGVRQAAEQLYAELQLARLTAIRNKKPCGLYFNSPGINQYINTQNNQQINLDQYRGGVHFMQTSPDGKTMSETIRFNRQGMSMSIAPANVYLSDQSGISIYRLRVMLPGGISLDRWKGMGW